MDIKRIDGYNDGRFSKTVLRQHGAYLIDGEAYEVEIIDSSNAVVRGKSRDAYGELIEYFRFNAPHIIKFFDEEGALIAEYPAPKLCEVAIDDIQPSQFFVDEEKLEAVRTFVNTAEDIVIQVKPHANRFISLDGHTRLYLAVQSGYSSVKAVVSETDDWVYAFVREAERRNVFHPKDMKLLPHERYVIEWDQYCDSVFAENGKDEI